jgi:Inner membrane protein YgaP-like, transmembrane domain
MNPMIKFLATTAGRITRIIAGIALIALGTLVVNGVGGIILAVVGLVPLVAGLFDFCVFAPLFGAPLAGKQIRASN